MRTFIRLKEIQYFIIFFIAFTNLQFTLQAEKMNILFISADDLNTDLGCYGNKLVKTPRLDRLAKMGVRFDRAYCQQSLCGPSRASVMMGLRPNTTRFFYKNDNLRKLKPDAVTLGQFFKNQGYYSARVGKIYHYSNPAAIGTNGHDDAKTWTERFNPKGIDKTREKEIIVYPESRKGKALGVSMSWWDPVSEDEEHTDGKVASKAIELIEKHKDKPFFIAAGFFNPHCPYVAPKKYFDLYPMNKIKMPDLKKAKEDLKDIPPAAIENVKFWPYNFEGLTVDQSRKCKQAYYASISFIDAQVGRLLDALENNNLIDKTMIVFWSDHGYFLGEKGIWFKKKNFERAMRTPMIIAGPGVKKGGDCYRTVELLDIYPTLVDYAGYKPPYKLDGVSLRSLLTNPKKAWDRPAFSQVHNLMETYGFSIRTADWRYTEWNKGEKGLELYNHKNDPHEVKNLSGDKKYKAIMAKLSKQLRAYSDTYKPRPDPSKRKKKRKKVVGKK